MLLIHQTVKPPAYARTRVALRRDTDAQAIAIAHGQAVGHIAGFVLQFLEHIKLEVLNQAHHRAGLAPVAPRLNEYYNFDFHIFLIFTVTIFDKKYKYSFYPPASG